MSFGASPSERDPDGRTALHACAIFDDAVTAEALIDHGADLDAKDNSSSSPFKRAVVVGAPRVAALLVRRGCALENFVPWLMEALQTESPDDGTRDLLVALRERLGDSKGPYLVHEAIERSPGVALRCLLEAGFDPNQRDACGKFHVSEPYTTDRSLTDKAGVSAVQHAVLRRQQASVRLLLRHGADKNDYLPADTCLTDDVYWYRPLLEPFAEGLSLLGTAGGRMLDADMVRLLLEEGADPNWKYPNGRASAILKLVLQAVFFLLT
jgi:ankyrin repeat protein